MVSFYEGGAHFLSDESQLRKLADYFNVTTDYLLGRSTTCVSEQTEKLNMLFAALPDADRGSIMDYSEYLLFRHKHSQK